MANAAMESAVNAASQAMDTSGIGKNTMEGLQMGMSLAQRQQQIEQARQEMNFKAQQAEMQKHDWLHSQLQSAASENDPKIKGVLLDNLDEQFPKLFEGKRMNPTTVELMKKAPLFLDKVQAAVRVRNAMRTGRFDKISDFDNEVVNGMTNPDVSAVLGHLNTIQQSESQIIKGIQTLGFTPAQAQAIAKGETSPEEQQKQMAASPKYTAQNARKGMLDARLDDQASNAGKAFDAGVSKLYTQQQALDRAQHTLSDPNTPITPQIFREAEKEFVTALTGSGSAGLGQTEKTEYNNLHLKIAEYLQKYGNKMQDLRTAAPELVKQLDSSMARLSGAYSSNLEDKAQKIDANFSQSGNEKVHAIRREKLKQYAPNYYKTKFAQQDEMETGTGNHLEPKKSPADMENIDNMAKERVRQAREAQKSGVPVSFTEDQVKETYKRLTGKDLVE